MYLYMHLGLRCQFQTPIHETQLLFIMNAVNQGGKRERKGGWETTLNQGDTPPFPEICYV